MLAASSVRPATSQEWISLSTGCGCSLRRTCTGIRAVTWPPNPARIHCHRLIDLVAPAARHLVRDRLLTALAGADADRLVDRADEDAAVADFAGVSRGDDRVHDLVDDVVGHDGLDLELGQQGDVRARAAVLLGVALLAPAPHDLGDRQAGHAELVERVLHL